MKERSKYHVADIINLVVFYSVFICLLVAFIIGTKDLIAGTLPLSKFFFRLAFLIVICLPFALKKIFKVTFSRVASTVYYLFIFLSAFLGNILELYNTTPAWDMVIHFLMGALIAVYSIYLLNGTIYKKDKSRHNLFFTIVFMILFSVGIGALWEIWEFCGDIIFGLNSQRFLDASLTPLVGQQALLDTMIDICMDTLGAITGVLFTLVMIKVNKRFLKSFVITKLKNKEEIENIEE